MRTVHVFGCTQRSFSPGMSGGFQKTPAYSYTGMSGHWKIPDSVANTQLQIFRLFYQQIPQIPKWDIVELKTSVIGSSLL